MKGNIAQHRLQEDTEEKRHQCSSATHQQGFSSGLEAVHAQNHTFDPSYAEQCDKRRNGAGQEDFVSGEDGQKKRQQRYDPDHNEHQESRQTGTPGHWAIQAVAEFFLHHGVDPEFPIRGDGRNDPLQGFTLKALAMKYLTDFLPFAFGLLVNVSGFLFAQLVAVIVVALDCLIVTDRHAEGIGYQACHAEYKGHNTGQAGAEDAGYHGNRSDTAIDSAENGVSEVAWTMLQSETPTNGLRGMTVLEIVGHNDIPWDVSAMVTQTSELHEVRLDRACALLRGSGAKTVLDLGCGSGALLQRLLDSGDFAAVTGLEESGVSIRDARRRLADWLGAPETPLTLLQGSFQQLNPALTGYDAAAMIEVIEHVPPQQLSTVEQAVFGGYQPGCLLLTTPNREYNSIFGLGPGEFRDPDHRFEWDRDKFRQWVTGVARRNGYDVRIGGIGDMDPDLGAPTQTAWFTRSRHMN